MAKHNIYKLDMLICSILAQHDCYGYQLTQIMKEESDGMINARVSSLYPILYRMMGEGYITSYEKIIKQKRKRVYYHLEAKGCEYLKQSLEEYYRLIRGIQGVLDYQQEK